MDTGSTGGATTAVHVPAGDAQLEADLTLAHASAGLVIFAHGTGSSRFSPRNRAVAQTLQNGGFATLLLDLLTRSEEGFDLRTGELRFDVELLSRRVVAAIDWTRTEPTVAALPIACFGASTGAAAALMAAAERPELVRAVVSRGGRPDLAARALSRVRAPALFIVGGADEIVLDLNRLAVRRMTAPVTLEIVPGATHLFEEPGALEEVSRLATDWCRRYLGPLAVTPA